MSEYIDVGKLAEFPDRIMRRRTIGDAEVAIVRVGAELFCFTNVCPHASGVMSDGYVRGSQVICIYHQAVFDLSSGKSVEGITPKPLAVYETRVENDEVQVLLPSTHPITNL